MTTGRRSPFHASILLLALLGSGAAQHLGAAEERPSEADLKRLNDAIARVEKQLSAASSEREKLQEAVFENERQIAQINASIRQLDTDIASEEARLQTLQDTRAELDTQRRAQQDTIARYLRSAWQNGEQETLKLLLNQQDTAQSSRLLHYYAAFNRARADKIAAFAALMADIDANAREITATTLQLQQNQETLSAEKASLQRSQERRREQMSALDDVLDQSGEELARLEEEREALALLIEELNRSIVALRPPTSTEPFADMRGKLPWPVGGRLLNSFGSRHELGDVTWQGVNISAGAGTEVRAIHGGRVVYADWFGNSGLLLIIDHGDGFMSLYAQNQQLLRATGDWVNGGDVIAAVGNTGGREDSALYFEIRQNGRSVDPAAWCQRR